MKPGLNVNKQVEFAALFHRLRRPAGRQGGAALNYGPYILRPIALPECGGPTPGKPFLSGSPEGEEAAAPLFDFVARRLHQQEESGKISGLLQEAASICARSRS